MSTAPEENVRGSQEGRSVFAAASGAGEIIFFFLVLTFKRKRIRQGVICVRPPNISGTWISEAYF